MTKSRRDTNEAEAIKYSTDSGLRKIINAHPDSSIVYLAKGELERRETFIKECRRIAHMNGE